jgi:uncharacterized repeat protein (TIGR03803 family)
MAKRTTSVACAVLGAAAFCCCAPARAATLKTLYSFGFPTDARYPETALLDVGSILYGTTIGGGTSGFGTVFKVNPAKGTEKILVSFGQWEGSGSGGNSPAAALISVGGTLYGTTAGGGFNNVGTVFKLNPAKGSLTVLSSFYGNGGDGAGPAAALLNVKGTLFGTTAHGGASGYGTVFKVNRNTGAEKVLYSFQSGSDGAYPYAALINVGGALYGTTNEGGTSNAGTVFKIDPTTGAETVLHSFGGSGDGAGPVSALLNLGGTLYGTTYASGTSGSGTVFQIDATTGAESVVSLFVNDSAQGDFPQQAGLVNVGGTLYGVSPAGTGVSDGVIYKVNLATGKLKTVYSFSGTYFGAFPFGSLINVAGTLYGTTSEGGPSNAGTVFSLTP